MDDLQWQELDSAALSDLVEVLSRDRNHEHLNAANISGQCAALPFYRRYKLYQLRGIQSESAPESFELSFLWDDQRIPLVLDGTSHAIHHANEHEDLQLSGDMKLRYLRFFVHYLRSGDGSRFILLEDQTGRPEIDRYIVPITLAGHSSSNLTSYVSTMLYQESIFRALLTVSADGMVTMEDEEVLAEITDSSSALPNTPCPDSVGFQQSSVDETECKVPLQDLGLSADTSSKSSLFLLVELLLGIALRNISGQRLLERFMGVASESTVLSRFAELLTTSSPVVVIESSIPFIEEVVATIVIAHKPHGNLIRLIVPKELDDGSLDIPDLGGRSLLAIPLQGTRRVKLVDRLAYDIALGDHSTVISCESFSHLPEPLRVLTDIRIKLPPINEDVFEVLVKRILNELPPQRWKEGEVGWVKHLLHTDFEHPRRMKFSREEAFDFIHGRVAERLALVDPLRGPSLDELQGLGEARQHALDLIADIRAAILKEIPWDQVDRGMLLVGPPGTGKTSLAMAIARQCDVKFIQASAASWQATGDHLGHHLRAIRASFSEARRYAPSIIFIDEIDGLGNRETFSGSGSQYSTEVVNAVLEQMQTLDPSAPVFVIGATNYEKHVDPALKRAGRLDRIVYVPRPGRDALKKIFDHYLTQASATIERAEDVDTTLLGRLSLGLTGADAEQIVRGAIRRARRRNMPLSQIDLLDELTDKPRSSDGAQRLSSSEVERIAIHESGHVLAMFLSPSKGSDIGYVTIVPRSDGTLGFAMHLPDDRVSITRSDCEEWLEMCLAGRAAEELQYGPTGVSSGCSDDLRKATDFCIRMLTQMGFGPRLGYWPSLHDSDRVLAEDLLAQIYKRILEKLAQNYNRLQALAKELIDRQDLTGDQVRALLHMSESI